MFISIVLNTEYMDIASRSKWYLKNLLHCKENGWILITHEYMRTHWNQMQDEITPSLFSSWEMRSFTADEVQEVEQYYIPDELFETIEKQCGSRTEMLWQLSTDANKDLQEYLQDIFDTIKHKHLNEEIQGVFHCLEAWQPLRNVCIYNNIRLIPYHFSAIRMPHGYRQTLYHANLTDCLHTSREALNRYEKFNNENVEIPIFTNRELIAIFGKEPTLPLIQLMNHNPKYEMGICTDGCSVIPQFFIHDKTTDDDVRFACEKLYNKSQIKVRNHSLQVDFMQLDRTTTHNDPAAWILSCRRLAAVRSQIGLKFMLWNRTAIMKPDLVGFAFMCEKDYTSTSKVDLKKLNYYLFAYLIPNDLMFSNTYWKWRMKNPTEIEIYWRHLNFIFEKLNISQTVLGERNEALRFKALLKSRGCDNGLITNLLCGDQDFDVDYNTASSCVVINEKSYWRLNHIEGDIRCFHVNLNETVNSIEFYPLYDVAGCACLKKVLVNGKEVKLPTDFYDLRYLPKITGKYVIPIQAKVINSIDIQWEYMTTNDYLKNQ